MSLLADAWEMVAIIAASQSHAVGYLQARRAEGELWSTLAKVAVQRAGDPYGLLEAKRQMDLGAIRLGAGDPAAASEAYATAVRCYTERLPVDHPAVARARYSLASSWVHQGRREEGVALLREVLQTQERSLGPMHPNVVVTRDALAQVLKAGDGS